MICSYPRTRRPQYYMVVAARSSSKHCAAGLRAGDRPGPEDDVGVWNETAAGRLAGETDDRNKMKKNMTRTTTRIRRTTTTKRKTTTTTTIMATNEKKASGIRWTATALPRSHCAPLHLRRSVCRDADEDASTGTLVYGCPM